MRPRRRRPWTASPRRGARFEHAQSPVPITGPSHATILTGQYPPVHGVRDNVVFTLGATHPTLATVLKNEGYRTGAFVGAIPVAAGYGFGQGFDTFDEDLHETPAGAQGAERRADEVADKAVAWLAQVAPAPFFAWVHLYDPHAPYAPPPPFDTRFAERPYDGEVAFADAQLGRILQALASAGRERDTVVAVMSDHGESLGDHGESAHAILIYESTLRVPLVLAGPAVPAGTVVPARVGLIDVMPTLLGLLGAEAPPLPGRDLRAAWSGTLRDEPLYAESLFGRLSCRWAPLRAWTEGDWKLVVGAEGEEELFDLGRDPGERTSIAAQQPQRVGRMHAALRAAVRAHGAAGRHGAPAAGHPRAGGPPPQPGLRRRRWRRGRAGRAGTARSAAARAGLRARAAGHAGTRARRRACAERDDGDRRRRRRQPVRAHGAGPPRVPRRTARHGGAGLRAFAGAGSRPAGRAAALRAAAARAGTLEDSERQLRIAVEQTADGDVRTPLSLAETLQARGNLEEAERVVDGVLAKTPGDGPALAAKARLLVGRGREADAVSYLERAGDGAQADDWVEAAELYLLRGQPARARECAEVVLRRSPGHPWAMALAGHALILEGKRDAGVTLARRALASRPRRPGAWLSLAAAFDAAGEGASAARCRRLAEEARRT